MNYDPRNWYWIVAGDTSQVYSSAVGNYVPANNAAYVAWLAAGGVTTRIINADELAEVLANASVRPTHADLLDRFKDSQAGKLTLELVAKVLFNHENRLRVLEGKQPITANQFKAALKAML